jgi:sirohydrochlorin cobaltochelatase
MAGEVPVSASDCLGLVLFAHGARDPRWAAPFEAVAERLAGRLPAVAVRLAYLELMQPSLVDAVTALVDEGCRQVTVVPMFLGAGGHVRRDLPALLDQLQAAHPNLRLEATPPLGEMPELVQAMADGIASRLGRDPAA